MTNASAVEFWIGSPDRPGQCAALALAISEATGWPMLASFAVGDPIPRHVLVQCPDGTLLDANTLAYGRTRLHDGGLKPITAAEIVQLVRDGHYAPLALAQARRLARDLLGDL